MVIPKVASYLVRREKKFQQKSYGERLFRLLCVWVEKIDWRELQVAGFLDYECEMHQKHFITFLYHLQRLKTEEKSLLNN